MKIPKQTVTLVAFISALAVYFPLVKVSPSTAPQEPTGQQTVPSARNTPASSPEPERPQSAWQSGTESAAEMLCYFFGLTDRGVSPNRLLLQSEREIKENSAASTDRYQVESLIATIPDPKDSRLDYLFDHTLDAIQRAIEATGYVLDRHRLLWDLPNNAPPPAAGKSGSTPPATSTRPRQDYQRLPSIILFRQVEAGKRRLLLLFLVGETPTNGIHKSAFRNALDQISMLPSWLTGEPADHSGLKVRVMGPTFSGSAVSLSIALKKWLDSYVADGKSRPEVQIISGSATAINKNDFLAQVGDSGKVTFHSTVPLDEPAKRAFIKYLVETKAVEEADQSPEIAILSEGNTAYGQRAGYGEAMRRKESGTAEPPVLYLTFPLHISQLRREATKRRPSRDDATNGLLSPPNDIKLPMDEAGEPRARDVIPLFSSLEPVSIEQVVTGIFSAINREPIRYVGLFTTDVQDRIFLVRELRKHCPNMTIFLFSIDLLYLHSEANLEFQGSLVISPYPLFSLNQLWTYPFNGDKNRLQFSTQNAQGCYNATLALLGKNDLLLEYGLPFDDGQQSPERRAPLWLSIVGRNAIWPVRTLSIEEKANGPDQYTYAIPAVSSGKSEIFVGYRDHSSLTSAVLLFISLICLAPSMVLLLQLTRERLDNLALKGPFYLLREKLNSVKFLNQSWIGRTFSFDHSLRYHFDRRVYLFSCCVSLLVIALGNIVVTLLPDWIKFKKQFQLEHGLLFHASAYLIFVLTLFVLILIVCWFLFNVVKWLRQSDVGHWSRTVAAVSLIISLGLFSLACLALCQRVMYVRQDDQAAAAALFFFLRATDLRSGVSLLLPWIFVGLASSLSFFAAVRRLDLNEKMHSLNQTPQDTVSSGQYLNFSTPSFTGLDKLEDKVKSLVIGRIFSVPGAFLMVFIIMVPYTHRFVTHHIPSIEGWGFDWFFIAAFYLIPLLLGWAFLRFFWLSLAMLRFLNRLGWHPLFNAPIDTEEPIFQTLPKINLMSPAPSYTAMIASLAHAQEFFTQLNKAGESERVTSWPNSIQKNIWVRIEEARQNLRRAIQAESEGRWQDALPRRHESQEAISSASKEIATWMEPHWFELNDPSAADALLIKRGRIFMMTHVAGFLQHILVHLQNLAGLVSIGFILILLGATSYPFQPRESLLLFAWVSILVVVTVTIFTFIQINRNKVFSLLSGSTPGQLNLSRDLVYRVLIHGVIPIATLLGAQFPETVRQIFSWLSFFKDGAQ